MDDKDVRRAIRHAQAVFRAALDNRDAQGAAAVYAADARLLLPASEVMAGRRAIQAFWQAGLDAGLAAMELVPAKVEAGDRMAYEIGRYVLHLRPVDGGPVEDRGAYVVVHERQDDGSWCRAVEMLGPDALPQPT